MIDPDYDSMADYVDVESINAYKCSWIKVKSPEQAFKIIQAKIIRLVRPCNGMLLKCWSFSRDAMVEELEVYKDFNVEKEMDGPIFTFYKEIDLNLRKEMPIISEGSYQHWKDSQEVYAFERHLNGQKLLVLNHFYGSEVEVAIPKTTKQGACSCQLWR